MSDDKRGTQAVRNSSKAWSIEARALLRRRVSALLIRGLTQGEIYHQLRTRLMPDGKGGTRPNKAYFENPKTHRPYSVGTLRKLVLDIWREWTEVDAESICDWRAEIVAHNRELERAAWVDHDLPLILSILSQRAKLLGAFAPIQYEDVTDAQAQRDLKQLQELLGDVEPSTAAKSIGAGESEGVKESLGVPGGE